MWKNIKNKFEKLKGLAQIGVSNILAAGISGIFWFYMASLLGVENYGELSYFIAIATIASTVSILGAGTTLVVYTAKGIKIQSTIYSLVLTIGTLSSIVVFFMFLNLGASLYVIGSVMFGLAISELLGRKLYKQYSMYFLGQRVLQIVLAVALFHLLGPPGVLLGFALSFLPYSIRLYQGFKETKIDFSLLKSRFHFTMNNYLSDLSRTISQSADKLLIAPLFGFALLGNYHLGIQFLTLLGIIPSIVFQYILPRDASGYSNKKLKKFTILFSIILAVIPILIAPVFIPVLFPQFEEAILIMQIVSIAIVPRTISYMYTSEFLAQEKNKFVVIGSGIYLTIQITLIFLLGELYSIIGVAVALVIASISETLFLAFYKRRLKSI